MSNAHASPNGTADAHGGIMTGYPQHPGMYMYDMPMGMPPGIVGGGYHSVDTTHAMYAHHPGLPMVSMQPLAAAGFAEVAQPQGVYMWAADGAEGVAARDDRGEGRSGIDLPRSVFITKIKAMIAPIGINVFSNSAV